MKKNGIIWIVIVFSLTILLVACGEKSQESVITNLDDQLEKMDGYKAKANMKMSTGQEEQQYEIDIWHKQEDFYRVTLGNKNEDKDSQVILKNADGVFVLTPALNRSFKFQTDWPENSSQPYLYQSLIKDIQADPDVDFKVTDSHYVFTTKTNYQSNNHLPYQEIVFDKKTYTPLFVNVLDKDEKALIEVAFTHFDLNPSFEEDDFKMDENMESGAASDASVIEKEEDPSAFPVMFPLYTANAEFSERKEVSLEDGERVIMTFSGDKSFTLIQEKRNELPAANVIQDMQGEMIDLGFTIGAISGNKLTWHNHGVEFYLASDDLTRRELIEVAKSVHGQQVK